MEVPQSARPMVELAARPTVRCRVGEPLAGFPQPMVEHLLQPAEQLVEHLSRPAWRVVGRRPGSACQEVAVEEAPRYRLPMELPREPIRRVRYVRQLRPGFRRCRRRTQFRARW